MSNEAKKSNLEEIKDVVKACILSNVTNANKDEYCKNIDETATKYCRTALFQVFTTACALDDFEVVKNIVDKKLINRNAYDQGLSSAVMAGNFDIVKFLYNYLKERASKKNNKDEILDRVARHCIFFYAAKGSSYDGDYNLKTFESRKKIIEFIISEIPEITKETINGVHFYVGSSASAINNHEMTRYLLTIPQIKNKYDYEHAFNIAINHRNIPSLKVLFESTEKQVATSVEISALERFLNTEVRTGAFRDNRTKAFTKELFQFLHVPVDEARRIIGVLQQTVEQGRNKKNYYPSSPEARQSVLKNIIATLTEVYPSLAGR